jgi:hypothetical protein
MSSFLNSSGGRATVQRASVARASAGGTTHNTIVVQRTLRIQLRDCRSGQPVANTPVEEIRVSGRTEVRFRGEQPEWDLAARLPYYKKAGKWAVGKTRTRSASVAVQEILKALGFNPGPVAETFSKQALSAWLRYRVARSQIILEPATITTLQLYRGKIVPTRFHPARGQTQLKTVTDRDGAPVPFQPPTEAEGEEIIRLYNTRCYQTAQHHLAVLGFVPKPDDPMADGAWDLTEGGTWSAGWIRAYHEWQKAVYGLPEEKCADWLMDPAHGKKLQTARARLRTDADGIIHLPLALSQLSEAWTVEVAFPHMAIIAESSAKDYPSPRVRVARPTRAHPRAGQTPVPADALEPAPQAPGFAIEWADTQGNNEWDQPWGWRVGPSPATSPNQRTSWPEFRTSWKFAIPAFNATEAAELDVAAFQRRTGVFSVFFHDPPVDPHFVVFGLRWSQPVWDDLPDPTGANQVSDVAYLHSRDDRNRHFHLVSMAIDLGGTDFFGGKGYAKYERELAPRFRGLDKPITELGALLRLISLGHLEFDGTPLELLQAYRQELEQWKEQAATQEAPGEDLPLLYQIRAYFLAATGAPPVLEVGLSATMIDHIDRAATEQEGAGQLLPLYKGRRTLRSAAWDRGCGDQDQDGRVPYDGHAGLDLHVDAGNEDVGGSRKGSPVFAVHGGKVSRVTGWNGQSSRAPGHAVHLSFTGGGAGYLHLDKILVRQGAAVRAGQVLGRGGRTGNFGNRRPAGSKHSTVSIWPSHLHLNVGLNNSLYRLPDEANRVCLPHNGSPMLLPCHSEVPEKPTEEAKPLAEQEIPKGCNFGSSPAKRPYISRCWAVHEFRCPYMPAQVAAADVQANQFTAVAVLQAWLRRWQIDQGKTPDDADAVRLDGALGNAQSRTRKAIRAYRQRTGLGDDDVIDDSLIESLSTLYPITRRFEP